MVEKTPCTACGALILPTTADATGGICMRCRREGPPKQSEIVKRAFATPARCLCSFKSSSTGDSIPKGDPRDQSARFQLACSCLANEFSILGYPMPSPAYPDQQIFAAPVSLACQACGKTAQLFHPDRDGYNGEIDSSAGVTGSGDQSEFSCPKCEATTFVPSVVLEYSLDDEEMEEWEELAASPQDFFTWFSLYGKCVNCGHLTDVTDYECA